MRRKKLFAKLIASGVWIQPLTMGALAKYVLEVKPKMLDSPQEWVYCGLISFIPALIYWSGTIGRPNEKDAITGKQRAMYPEVPVEMLFKTPSGICLGVDRRTGRYVCKRLDEDGHIFLIGGSGSGKSSAYIIPALLLNNNRARICAVDIKNELSSKSVRYGSKGVYIFNPSDRNSYGYDPLYNLDENSTTQQIMETMQTITFSLIALPAGLKDPFWKNSARNLLIGLLVFFYKQGITVFVCIIDEILSRPVKELIQEVLEKSRPGSVEFRYLVQFKDMEDETLGGIIAEMNNHIVIFANDQDIRYAFKDNPNKISPMTLEDKDGGSVYLSIKEEKLSAYYDCMQLIINQTLAQLEKRPEDSDPILFVIDELPRILSAGKIDRLLDGARTLRSRKVTLYLVSQSTEALMQAFTENEVADLISNCPYIIVLSASSTKTQKQVIDWCGKYKARKTSWNSESQYWKTSVSYDEKDIVTPSELITLKQTGEAIVITPYGYLRLQKTPYYKDKFLKPLADEVSKYNKTILSL